MTPPPSWLPPIINWTDYSSDWKAFNEKAYAVFVQDIKLIPLVFKGKKIVFDGRLDDGKEESFWHITTEIDAGKKERLPDLERTQRITWLKPIVQNSTDTQISIWERIQRKGKSKEKRIYLWLENYDYVVVLSERKDHYFLVTAFCTNGESTKKKLRRDREEYSKNGRGSP